MLSPNGSAEGDGHSVLQSRAPVQSPDTSTQVLSPDGDTEEGGDTEVDLDANADEGSVLYSPTQVLLPDGGAEEKEEVKEQPKWPAWVKEEHWVRASSSSGRRSNDKLPPRAAVLHFVTYLRRHHLTGLCFRVPKRRQNSVGGQPIWTFSVRLPPTAISGAFQHK